MPVRYLEYNRSQSGKMVSSYASCVNCGRQVLFEDRNSKCYWCGKSVFVKEVEMESHDGEYTEESMIYIAKRARALGCKKVAAELGLPWQRVAGWMNRYAPIDKPKKSRPESGEKEEKEGIEFKAIPDSEVEELRRQLKWHEGYRQAVLDIFNQSKILNDVVK